MPSGVVSFVDLAEQCGIIIQDNGKFVFFHTEEAVDKSVINKGNRVDFELAEDRHGKVAQKINRLIS